MARLGHEDRAQMHRPRCPKLHPARSSTWSLNSTRRVSSQRVQPGYSFLSTERPKKWRLSCSAYARHSSSCIRRSPGLVVQRPLGMACHEGGVVSCCLLGGAMPGTNRSLLSTRSVWSDCTRGGASNAASMRCAWPSASGGCCHEPPAHVGWWTPLRGGPFVTMCASTSKGLYHMANSAAG